MSLDSTRTIAHSPGRLADQSGLPEKAIVALQDVFRSHPRVREVTLYGSRAMGTFRNGSDIDLTIHGREIDWQELLDIEQEIDDLLLPWKTDLSLYDQIDNESLREHIQRVGVCFWEREQSEGSDQA
ncbi:nucleotidyltransferase domain-containing protein [Marinobacter sp.]|uniref:nucleotidyltransferase domain-containing protein n=1 Tax=Marinobacter sp. TaxID=50741 RepID=UPI00384E4E45